MSEMMEASYGQLSTMETGEFAGWRYWQGDPYETRSGPFFYRREEDGAYVSAFRAEAHHMNGGWVQWHGGCLMTFADFRALFAIATDGLKRGSRGDAQPFAGDFLWLGSEGALSRGARGER